MKNETFTYNGRTITFGEEVVANIPLHSVMIDGNLLMHMYHGEEQIKLFFSIDYAIDNATKFIDSLIKDEERLASIRKMQ
jgi:hypothetical protein